MRQLENPRAEPGATSAPSDDYNRRLAQDYLANLHLQSIMQLTRIGPFALEEPLDGLAQSNVLRAVHVEQQRSMAVKLLPRQIVNQPMRGSTFADDHKLLQKLRHPTIVRYYGGAVEQGQPYLALELVEGESLRTRLDRRGRLPWEMAVDMADHICVALHHAHAHGIVHQRLTPKRILFTEDDSVKLSGFDCVWADRDEVLGLRSPMEVAHYLAPEVYRGKQSASHPQGDLFSLGVILFECLTGELPWPASSPSELVQARRDSTPPRISVKVLECPVWLDVLVEKLLATKRQDRFESAEETYRAIVSAKRKVAAGTGAAQQAWSGQKGSLTVSQDREEVRRIKRKRIKKRDDSPFYERAWFLGLCLLAVIGLGVWVLWPLNEDQLFAKARPLMQSEEARDWKAAEERYLTSYRERFPDSKYAEELAEFDTKVAIHKAEKRLDNNLRLSRTPKSEAERQMREARRLEQFGDRLTAWNRYEALINLFEDSEDEFDQAFVALAQRHIKGIKDSQGPQQSQTEFLEAQLEKAEKLMSEGDPVEARKVLDGIVELYQNNREAASMVKRAEDALKRLELTRSR